MGTRATAVDPYADPPVRPQGWSTALEGVVDVLAAAVAREGGTAVLPAALEQVALAFDADVVALVRGDDVLDSVGRAPADRLLAVAAGTLTALDVAGAGRCHALRAAAGSDVLVVARSTGPLEPEQRRLLGSTARALGLVLELVRRADAEHELRSEAERRAAEDSALLAGARGRQDLLERLADVQQAIAQRLPLPYVLAAVAAGARQATGAACVALVLDEPPEALRPDPLVAWDGDEALARAVAEDPAAAAGLVLPVHEGGRVAGRLVAVAGPDAPPGDPFSDTAAGALLAWAEHASLALTDARTLETLTRAFHDPLTGLATRALLHERLSYALAGAARRDTPVGLLFLDLDRFKLVNDTLGHAAGDDLLVGLAERLRRCLRASDTAARFGGDEFVVLLEDTAEDGAVQVADQVLDAVRQPFLLSGQRVLVDASVGVAVARPSGTLTRGTTAGVRGFEVSSEADALLRAADVAMYAAKRAGKGRIELYRPEMSSGQARRLDLESGLRQALDRGELVLEFQPVVRLRDGALVSAEALLRWSHPVRGVVHPEEFIPVAEETGLIVPMGRWALREACHQAARWQRVLEPGADPVAVAVNLSARQLELPGFAEDVEAALAASALPPHLLCLELTETLLVRDLEPTAAALRRLKEIGVEIAVDDFGTGYSSLAHLWSFPVDKLKIDRSFVAGMRTEQGEAFVRAILGLARSLGLAVVGEGIETPTQLAALRAAGCGQGQGALFSWSLPAPGMLRLITGEAQLPIW
ncbi:diguanylate cyclase (GGDEF)-like protein [Motilibacter rhizosphaerae]|uniref:Diguanylate cyclase (GGDEF)-like protein n=1 Tax=Motilibacter rhizosphaerae TaxID=598652 RepID=A0A4Q7NWS2_9ACTN|nr:EAL domain-containing protein [Motilibacter rhizosphaerae]RZS91460.1 diguanylate cyclase (GGDEF)-like protein [Motilibacter rhizosphaerae]